MDDETWTWAKVAARLARAPRGTQTRLAELLDHDPSYFSRKLKSRDEPSASEARKIDSFFEAVDAGQPFVAEDSAPFIHEIRRVPVYGLPARSAGPDRILFSSAGVLDVVELPMGINPRGEAFKVRQLGSTMAPRIFDGEEVLVSKGLAPIRDRDVFIEFTDGSGTLKTYKGERDGRVWVEEFNGSEKLVDYPSSTVAGLHLVLCRF